MPSPFPGMDPFLEDPAIFPDLHDSAVTYLREALRARLPGAYFAALGSRVWIETSHRTIGPDVNVLQQHGRTTARDASGVAVAPVPRSRPVKVRILQDEVRESFVEVYARDGRRLVTSIEILSLSNKTPGEQGRDLYVRKQKEVLGVQAHVMEIDLLRGGLHTTAVPRDLAVMEAGAFDYHVCVKRFDKRSEYDVYPILLAERLPEIAVPLLPGDADVALDLQALLDKCYEVGAYGERVDYAGMHVKPPLSPEQAAWADQVLRARGLVKAGDA